MNMKTQNSAWGLFAVASVGLGILLGCDAHNRLVNAAKRVDEAQPLFTPVTASLAQQKMCDEQAAKKFRENDETVAFHEERRIAPMTSYTSHYDSMVNVCYVSVHSYGGTPLAVTDIVYDAFGGRVYANYIWINPQNKQFSEVPTSQCEIYIPGKPDEKCKTDSEFYALTEKYFGVTQ